MTQRGAGGGPELEGRGAAYAGRMDPADAAELARRMRAAVVHEVPRRRWALPAVVVLVVGIALLAVMLLG